MALSSLLVNDRSLASVSLPHVSLLFSLVLCLYLSTFFVQACQVKLNGMIPEHGSMFISHQLHAKLQASSILSLGLRVLYQAEGPLLRPLHSAIDVEHLHQRATSAGAPLARGSFASAPVRAPPATRVSGHPNLCVGNYRSCRSSKTPTTYSEFWLVDAHRPTELEMEDRDDIDITEQAVGSRTHGVTVAADGEQRAGAGVARFVAYVVRTLCSGAADDGLTVVELEVNNYQEKAGPWFEFPTGFIHFSLIINLRCSRSIMSWCVQEDKLARVIRLHLITDLFFCEDFITDLNNLFLEYVPYDAIFLLSFHSLPRAFEALPLISCVTLILQYYHGPHMSDVWHRAIRSLNRVHYVVL